MDIGGQARPLRTREEVEAQLRAAAAASAAIALPAAVDDRPDDDPGAPLLGAPGWRLGAAVLAVLLGILWLALLGYVHATRWPAGADPLTEAVALVPLAAAPLALLGIGWLLVARTGRREARRFARTAGGLRDESARLESVLADLSARMDDHRRLLADGAERLLVLGDDAAGRMGAIGSAITNAGATLARQSDALGRAAAAARGEMDVLMADLPQAEAHAAAATAALREAGLVAHEQAGLLEDRLTTITTRGREAEESAGGAAARLAAQLARVESAGSAAGRSLEAVGITLRGEADAALAAAAQALGEARTGIDEQGRAMRALVAEAGAAFDVAGADAARLLDERLGAAGRRLDTLGETLAAQEATARALLGTLDAGAQAAETRFAGFEAAQRTRIETLTAAIEGLKAHTDRTLAAIGDGNDTADALIARTNAITAATDAIATALGETLPPLLDRAAAKAVHGRAAAEGALPAVHALAEGAAAAAGRLDAARAELARQEAAIAALADTGDLRLDGLVARAQAFAAGLADAQTAAGGLAESAGPALVEALVRVRETAVQAADKARTAIGAVIPEAADALGRASADAMEQALTARVEEQMARIAATAEDAVRAAHAATDRLMRQMLTIADTTSAVERRIEEARGEAQTREEEGFPRQAALLIESLNSLSIDVAKALSADPGDAAWAAYMRGDRSVFTRRAVRLLDGGQLKEVARHYEAEPAFRDQVNRYIHDFEAMLRRVLASRDGASLGVTLLSSDIGKLYVALAQAIERLRT